MEYQNKKIHSAQSLETFFCEWKRKIAHDIGPKREKIITAHN
jgi:hypothetical protein